MQNKLAIYTGLLKDPAISALMNNQEKEALGHLILFAEQNGIRGNVWRQYVCRLMAADDNIFSYTAEMQGGCGSSLMELANQDIVAILAFVYEHDHILNGYIPTSPSDESRFSLSVNRIAEAIDKSAKEVLHMLFVHYKNFGRGLAARYMALEWKDGLCGIEKFDRIQLDDLIGIESQKEALITNTERFIDRRGANNILVFGDSGTGKSSCVKALINRYNDQGLRLLELKKSQLSELEEVFSKLAKSSYRYIVFLDDLSFEEGELGYKALKAALEGKASQTPENVLFYATSNRRHLVKETWADRVLEREEVHLSDTMHEKLSLSERFGLTVLFVSPGQDEYLGIVEGLCNQNNIRFTEEIRTAAVQWALYHSGRSGRTAKQFVNTLV